MRLSIFARLALGYLLIFTLVVALSVYAFLQLRQFSAGTRLVLSVDNELKEYEERLTDSLFSQLRYERKFMIVRDEALYDQFVAAKDTFLTNIEQLSALTDSPREKETAERIRAFFDRYQSLVSDEAHLVRKSVAYDQKAYTDEKENAVNRITDEMKRLRAFSEQDTYAKIKQLGDAETAALQALMALAFATLLLVIFISLFITRGITKPISKLVDKTKEIADGVFQCDLDLSSPPEIGTLANAFNSMCVRLRMVDKMKTDFFSTMSHELRTPLTSIKEGTNLLIEGVGGGVTEKQLKLLTIISEESNRLIELVNSLLDLSKMEAGMMTFHKAETDIRGLVGRVVSVMEPLTLAKSIGITLQVPPSLPLISVDGERILQVLRNLLGNAIKFTPYGGKVTVSVSAQADGLQVTVSDTGSGIPKESLTTVFEKFQQLSVPNIPHFKGTGLGLAIVRHIITAHGGRVWAESEPGKGSSFKFSLPLS
jgi:two-component system sensor histidine kinase GlrK